MEKNITLSEIINKLDIAFPLTGLPLAAQILRTGMDASHMGKIDAVWQHANDTPGPGATLRIHSQAILSWGNDWKAWEAGGTLQWWTTSGHYVKVTVLQEEHNGDIVVDEVVIGNDESRIFYSELADVLGFVPENVNIPHRPL